MGRARGKYGPYVSHILYTVWNNKTDELIALDQPKRKCAMLMNLTLGSFDSAVCRAKSGKIKKWHIETRMERELNEQSQ